MGFMRGLMLSQLTRQQRFSAVELLERAIFEGALIMPVDDPFVDIKTKEKGTSIRLEKTKGVSYFGDHWSNETEVPNRVFSTYRLGLRDCIVRREFDDEGWLIDTICFVSKELMHVVRQIHDELYEEVRPETKQNGRPGSIEWELSGEDHLPYSICGRRIA